MQLYIYYYIMLFMYTGGMRCTRVTRRLVNAEKQICNDDGCAATRYIWYYAHTYTGRFAEHARPSLDPLRRRKLFDPWFSEILKYILCTYCSRRMYILLCFQIFNHSRSDLWWWYDNFCFSNENHPFLL